VSSRGRKEAEAAQAYDQEKYPRGTESILVVDDDQAVVTLIERMLVGFGYHVRTAESSEEALQFLKEDPAAVDLVITDVVMPRLGGWEMAGAMRNLRPDLPVLFMTGYSTNAIHDAGVLKQGVDFLQKPPLLGDLLRKVREILDRRQ